MTLFVLVRHGQTEWNRVERFRGRVDVPLNEVGLAQAEATARRIAGQWTPAAVYSSPLGRAITTAGAIARCLDLAVEIHPGLVDIDFGQWHGLTQDEVKERWPALYDTWSYRPQAARIPDGETLDDLRTRAMAMISDLAGRHPSQTVVLVGHTVINRVILLGVLGLGNDRFWRLRQDTCAINVFEAADGDFTVVSLNDTCHLRSA